MDNNIWKIEKAGLYFFGHVNRYFLHVELSRPGAGWGFAMQVEKVQEFLDILGIDYEDGKYVHDVLKGKLITAIGKDGKTYGVSVSQVGDPYGDKLMDVGDAM